MKKFLVSLLISPIFTILYFWLFPAAALADDLAVPSPSTWLGGVDTSGWTTGLSTLMKARSWSEAGSTLVPAFFNLSFFLSILICLFLIVRSGFMFVFSEGNKENFVKARVALTQALIGLALILSVFVIFNAVQLILGVNLANITQFGNPPRPCTDIHCQPGPH